MTVKALLKLIYGPLYKSFPTANGANEMTFELAGQQPTVRSEMPSVAENFPSQEAGEPTCEEKPFSPGGPRTDGAKPQDSWRQVTSPLCPAESQCWWARKLLEVEAQGVGFKAVNATPCLEWAGRGKSHFFDAGAPEIAARLDSQDTHISERT